MDWAVILVIILDMHSGDIFPNFVRIPLVVLCKIGINGNLYRGFRLGKLFLWIGL